ncbi:ATP-binding cassette domain-containing protein [Intestinimonas butyriciproducens]|uniref:ATP-binding cassette domain-containing protein n=1 Tax=Intestinimonas butyriciproducens TaxID=1297617 RepID=UPI00195CEB36|nr:ATP-binding cassette domain-containing protein [Intestinimonas butyriciproducens]MBM6919464.1 ATP-binding cassette domain-containing protein [Intestinimonas butyriciproducens]
MSITLRNIQKSFGAKKVLTGVDYTLEDGKIYCLMGPSGMGKTTLLRILMGLENPDAGTIDGLGENDIAAMFQEDRLFMWLSPVENVAIMYKTKPDREKIAENLAKILPADCLSQPVSQLSGGMKRRVALARAMHFPAKLIILDEPFTGLDKDTRQQVIDYILEMKGDRILLVATHGVDDAKLLGATVIRLEELGCGNCAGCCMDEEDEAPILSQEEVLQRVKLFEGLSAESRTRVIQRLGGYEVSYGANEAIWRQEESRENIGVILRGCVQAEISTERESQIIRKFYAGETFGEAIAVGKQSSWVEVWALQETRILFIPTEKLLQDMDDRDLSLMKSNLIRGMAEKLTILSLKNQLLAEPRLRKRILMYLSTLKTDPEGFKTLPFSQKEAARHLNANYSAYCREISRMREEGIIEGDGRKIRIK